MARPRHHGRRPPIGPEARGTTFTEAEEEAIVVESRRRALRPLDDALGCPQDAIPKPPRGALHRCLMRHSIS